MESVASAIHDPLAALAIGTNHIGNGTWVSDLVGDTYQVTGMSYVSNRTIKKLHNKNLGCKVLLVRERNIHDPDAIGVYMALPNYSNAGYSWDRIGWLPKNGKTNLVREWPLDNENNNGILEATLVVNQQTNVRIQLGSIFRYWSN